MDRDYSYKAVLDESRKYHDEDAYYAAVGIFEKMENDSQNKYTYGNFVDELGTYLRNR